MPETAHNPHITGYLQHLQTQRKLSGHTLENYQRDLGQLLVLANEKSLTVPALSNVDVRRFAAQLHARGLSPASIARKLSAWRGFFNWLGLTHGLAANPTDGVKPPKRAKTLPKALGVDDAIKLVTLQPEPETTSPEEHAQRACNRAMFELLYSSGLRVSELTSLDLRYYETHEHVSTSWLDLATAEVTVTGKGSKRRAVPVGSAARQAIRDWLSCRNELMHKKPGADACALFITARGQRITARAVQIRIKKHAQALGIPADVHPHMLRHSFASHVLQSSGDLRAVQEMLGHASIASTQIYTSLDFQRLAQVYDAAHPRAKKQNSRD